ncbi:MAG: TonB family protein [Ignavibacteriales bacterium]|nr:TonB family protein [Ignavibacteriales bacterium]
MKTDRISFFISLFIHLAFMFLFLGITFYIEQETDEFVTIGFTDFGLMSSSNNQKMTDEIKPIEKVEKDVEIKKDDKKIDVPVVKNLDDDNIKTDPEKTTKDEEEATNESNPFVQTDGEDQIGPGNSNEGFDLDFGGQNIRKIYSYIIPEYPSSVNKDADVKLRFTILPDGTVGQIFTLVKSDARFEQVAIQSLKKWRFEPLAKDKEQKNQTAIIVFPFRIQ